MDDTPQSDGQPKLSRMKRALERNHPAGRGLRCPWCGEVGSYAVEQTKTPTVGYIQRKRVCKQCNKSFVTQETVAKKVE